MNKDMKTERDNTLFSLVSDKQVTTDLSRPLVGIFTRMGNDRFFEFEDYSTNEEYRLTVQNVSDEKKDNLFIPFIDFLEDERLSVAVGLEHQEDTGMYCAVSMELRKKGKYRSKSPYSEELFHIIVSRLINATAAREEEAEPRPFLRKAEEITAYFKTCRHTFPSWLVKAMEKELDTINSPESSAEQRKHAKASLLYLANIDWGRKKLNAYSVKEARRYLDSEFYSLESVKERILEIVAQVNRTGTLPVWGILLAGPAGTGKTSIAKAIATLLNLPTIPVDLTTFGGDPSALAGSGRIYSNGKPGHILDRMLDARSSSGVLLINEIEKSPTHGKEEESRIADILLSVLDRHGFQENYLEVNIPTDGLLAVATCNDPDKLSEPLKSRFYIITIPGYTAEQKRVIWRDYTLPKIAAGYGLEPNQLSLTKDALAEMIDNYATEPGVRDLERIAEKLCGALVVMLDEKGENFRYKFTVRDIRCRLGAGNRAVHRFAINPGEINSVYYHEGNARCYLLEASVIKGKGEFQVLGAVPELQKDYIKVAYECFKKTMNDPFSQKDVTVFLPSPIPDRAENNIGCAVFAALSSLVLNIDLAIQDIAFVGGVDLNGNLYFDEADVMPLMRAIENSGITTVYAPLGVGELLSAYMGKNIKTTVIEAQNVKNLMSVAMAKSRAS